jgi:hypothetical protein
MTWAGKAPWISSNRNAIALGAKISPNFDVFHLRVEENGAPASHKKLEITAYKSHILV